MEMNARCLTTVAAFAVLTSLGASTLPARAQALAYCKADAERLCPGVRPGGGRLVKCLKANENEVSIGCAKEIKKTKDGDGEVKAPA
jgi:hypothetical protein